jgi:sugar phosphate isomerase/epimerase
MIRSVECDRHIIGCSTNSLHLTDTSTEERIKLIYDVGFNGVEIGFAKPEQVLSFKLSEETEKLLRNFSFISIHAPWQMLYQSDDMTEKVLSELREICIPDLDIRGVVVHPDRVDEKYFKSLVRSDLPIVIENMDPIKIKGTTPDYFRELIKKFPDLGIVLDVEHVLWHDPSLKLMDEFLTIIGNNLSHFHLSGRRLNPKETHTPLIESENVEVILAALPQVRQQAPIILESTFTGNSFEIKKKMSLELGLVRSSR